jgi:hypothetical protein
MEMGIGSKSAQISFAAKTDIPRFGQHGPAATVTPQPNLELLKNTFLWTA